jgi:glycosyltransferase involved in cell wall biosynthesis
MREGYRISVIIPTLNEEQNLRFLLESLKAQEELPYEIIVADGGSSDRTLGIAATFGAKTLRLPGLREFPSSNCGAELADGDILLFTGADVVLPRRVIKNIANRFRHDPDLLAIGGPGIPRRPPVLLGVEYVVYNVARFLANKLPRPLKRFSASTNLLAIRKNVFEQVGPLGEDPMNADGRLAAMLCARGKVHFSYHAIRGYMSSRRLHEMGFLAFNRHYLYVIENFLPTVSQLPLIHQIKVESATNHSRMSKESYVLFPGASSARFSSELNGQHDPTQRY